MLHSRYIVVQDLPDGGTETLYQGGNSQLANEAIEKAVAAGTAEAVLEFCHPMPNRVRYPAKEALEAQERLAHQKGQAKREEEATAKLAADMRAQAEQLLKGAAELDGATEEGAPASSKKGRKKSDQ